MEQQHPYQRAEPECALRPAAVLKDITLNIPDRKITAIIGPSGCGKTTLLKSFNRLTDSIEG